MNNLPQNSESRSNGRSLRVFTRGGHRFAVFEEEIATVADWRQPTPLPGAPDAILGVAGIEGRMLTVLDLARMPASSLSADASRNGLEMIVALRGDEQLALAVDALGETIEVAIDDDTAERPPAVPHNFSPSEAVAGLILSTIKHGDGEISILNLKELFATALQGRERRRRRF